MAITPNFLSQCTDEQINRGVAWLEIIKLSKMLPAYSVNRGDISSGASIGLINTDYCANPNDIMPIQIYNEIDLRFNDESTDKPTAAAHDGEKYSHWSTNKNPLRAICEVYILMMVAK